MSRSKGGPRRWLALLVVLAATAVVIRAIARRFTRYEVVGPSMLPAYRPGDWLIVDQWAYRHRPPRPGDLVLAADPREPSRTLLKRVTRVEADGATWLEGDNPSASTDSRHFGPVAPEELRGRVVCRYWPLRR